MVVASTPVALRRMGSSVASSADRAQLGAGALCLDFAATVDRSIEPVVDELDAPSKLAGWFATNGLPVPAGGVTSDDLEVAGRLRSAVDRIARALIVRAVPDPADVRTINLFARQPTPVFLLRPNGHQRTVVEEIDGSGSLSVVARDAIHVFADSDLNRLRECARPSCTTLFYDRSPSGKRRWCAMKGCGEIVASAAYRRRRAEMESS